MASIPISHRRFGRCRPNPYAREHLPWLRGENFSHITAPGLAITGDADELPLSARGPAWSVDPYTLSINRESRSLLTVYGGEHSLGAIAGYAVAETTDENPDRAWPLPNRSPWPICGTSPVSTKPTGRRPRPSLEATPTRWAAWSPCSRQRRPRAALTARKTPRELFLVIRREWNWRRISHEHSRGHRSPR